MTEPSFASTPISRRNRRRQQKSRKINRQTEDTKQRVPEDDEIVSIGLWALRSLAIDDRTFDSSVDTRPSHGFHDSNPFSLLDISIPSPTLSVPSPHQEFFGWSVRTQQHDLHGIQDSLTTNSRALPKRQDQKKKRQHRRDTRALSLQQNTAVTRSESPKRQKFTITEPASVTPLCSIHPDRHDASTTAKHEDTPTRIPSPLLYHRRSKEAASDPMRSESSDFTPPSESIYRYSLRDSTPQSETRASPQQEKSLPIEEKTSHPFIAARLPLMGGAPSHDKSKIQSDLDKTGTLLDVGDECKLSNAVCTPPILTTTNTYIFPKRVYKVYCQPNAAWSGPSYTTTHCSWKSARNPVFPKLSIPGQKVSSNPNPDLSGIDSGNSRIRHHRIPLKTSLPVSLPVTFDPRCRSSTQDSFDSKFDVGTATKRVEPSGMESVSVQQKSECLNGVGGLSSAVQEPTLIDTTRAGTENDALTEDLIAWFSDACHVQDEDTSPKSEFDALPTQKDMGKESNLDEELGTLDASHDAEDTSEQNQEVWFDYCTPIGHADNGPESAVHVDINDTDDDDDWLWDDQNDWETIASTSATEVDGQLRLDVDGWAW